MPGSTREEAQAEFETANRLRRTVAASARLPAALTVEAAVRAVMCTLTERLTAGEAHDVLARIPRAVAPMFERCVLHRVAQPTRKIDRAEFLADVGDHLSVSPAHAELICSAVFTAVRAELPEDVANDVAAQLPHGLKELWLNPPVSAPDLDVEISLDDARVALERDLERRAELPPHVTPAAAFVAVMCTFSRRLSGGEARQVLLGLPPPVRALVERCASHPEQAAVFGRDDLLESVAEHLTIDRELAARIILEVLRAVKRALPQQTIADVASQLPPDLRELWEEALPAHQATS